MSSPKSGFMCKHCSVCNCSSNTGVMVLVPAVPASIYKVSEDIIVNEGNNVTLTCFANGRPEPAISWRLLNPSGKDQPVGRDDQQSRSNWPVIAWTPEYFDCPMMFLSFCQKCVFKGRWRNTARLLNVATHWLSAHICWDLWWKQLWAFSRESERSDMFGFSWLVETLITTSRGDDRAMLMENSSIFINYCGTHQHFRHISATPSVSCTCKLNHMDGCALPPLSVCIRGEPFVCIILLSHMVV